MQMNFKLYECLKNALVHIERSETSEISCINVTLISDIMMSGFTIIERKAGASEVSTWASNCSSSVNPYSVGIEDIAGLQGTTTVIPSVCDGTFYTSFLHLI